jgi:hypothetical protein
VSLENCHFATLDAYNLGTLVMKNASIGWVTAKKAETLCLRQMTKPICHLDAPALKDLIVDDSVIQLMQPTPKLTHLAWHNRTAEKDVPVFKGNLVISPPIQKTPPETRPDARACYVLAYNITTKTVLTPWGAFGLGPVDWPKGKGCTMPHWERLALVEQWYAQAADLIDSISAAEECEEARIEAEGFLYYACCLCGEQLRAEYHRSAEKTGKKKPCGALSATAP